MKKPNDIVNFLYGTKTKYCRAIAYCKYHHCFLTTKMAKQHKCLAKQCSCFDKITSHPYWEQRERKKKLKGGNK